MAVSVTLTFPVAGTYTWIAPPDVTSVSVELWGGGGTGGPATGNPSRAGGGAGGQYAVKAVTVTPGNSYTVVVAGASTALTATVVAGNDSTFATTTVVAKGGAGGLQSTGTSSTGGVGATTGGVGDTVNAGGSGGAGTAGGSSGGGGGGAGSTGTGNSGVTSTAGVAKSLFGGAGGTGVSTNGAVNNGNVYGGGGSGGLATGATDQKGGNGAQGYAQLTFTTDYPVIETVSSSISTGFAAGAAYTWSHTVGTAANGKLVVDAAIWQDVGGTGTLSGVTYGGVALTKAVEKTVTGGAMRSEQWYLDSPAAGTANIVATVSGNTDARKFGASTLFNAAAGAPEATQTGETFVTPMSLSITTIANTATVIDSISSFGTGAITPGANQNTIYSDAVTSIGGGATYKYQATAGAVTMTWTKGASSDTAQTAISVAPYVAPPPPSSTGSTLALMGVG